MPLTEGNTHELKTWPAYFDEVVAMRKTFEVRRCDRLFTVGDVLRLNEFNPRTKTFTGRSISKRVTYILHGGQFGIEPDYCVMGLGFTNDGETKS